MTTFKIYRVARLGFEPKYSASKADVLPLDDLAIYPAIVPYFRVKGKIRPCPAR